ncbi:OmpA family protein [uncultured Dokdonia sp.]|uniref:OmpA family protein n=1 Tax=uncultured Dokdonia sp. TaxID=575653 RepID=UPI00262234E2|nr:OmpA family protein [uncultured Dokdonia sp.]
MKGFWGTFFIFLLWAMAGIYYIHIKEAKDIPEKSPITIPVEKKVVNTTPLEIAKTVTPESATESPEIVIDSVMTDITITDSTLTSNATTINEIDDSSLYINDNTNVDSQLLAEEIKKSIAISDTIDINKDEPTIEYKSETIIAKIPNASSQIFYPRYANTDLILDKELIAYATQLKKILKENPDKKVTVIGHTDNVGNAEDNFRIALKKSRQIKWYLTTQRGIKRSRISAISRGESSPIEDNSSTWGRKKNNRIEIIVD